MRTRKERFRSVRSCYRSRTGGFSRDTLTYRNSGVLAPLDQSIPEFSARSCSSRRNDRLKELDFCVHRIVTQILEDSNHHLDDVRYLFCHGVTLHDEDSLSDVIRNERLQDVCDDLRLCVRLAVQYLKQPEVTGLRLKRRVRVVLEMRPRERVGEKSGPGCAENASDVAARFGLGLLAERQDLFLNRPVVPRGQSIPPAPYLTATPRGLTLRLGPECNPSPPRDFLRRPEAHPASSPGHITVIAIPRLNLCKGRLPIGRENRRTSVLVSRADCGHVIGRARPS